MKSKCSVVVLMGAALLLSACSATQVKKKPATSSAKGKVTMLKRENPAAEKYQERRSSLLSGVTITSTNNTCVDHFNFLRESKSEQYSKYTKDYGDLGKGYRFLNVNKNIMDEDAKKIYTMALDMKLNTLCSKVQYTGYSVVKEKIKSLSGI